MAENLDPNAYLIEFLTKFTLLVEKELLSIRSNVVQTVESVMHGIEAISQTAENNKRDAENLLEFTYLNPDVETELLLEDIQQVADELIESVYQQVESKSSPGGPVTTSHPESVVQNRLNRFSVKLDESMERMTTFDDSLNSAVLGIVGALSTEDLIAQRLEHVILSLNSLQTGLSFLLIDYEHRCRFEEVEKVVKSILTYTYLQYTAEEEKQRFKSIFGAFAA